MAARDSRHLSAGPLCCLRAVAHPIRRGRGGEGSPPGSRKPAADPLPPLRDVPGPTRAACPAWPSATCTFPRGEAVVLVRRKPRRLAEVEAEPTCAFSGRELMAMCAFPLAPLARLRSPALAASR